MHDDLADLDRPGADPYRARPRITSRKAIAATLNRLAVCLNAAHAELTELRRELKVPGEAIERPAAPGARKR